MAILEKSSFVRYTELQSLFFNISNILPLLKRDGELKSKKGQKIKWTKKRIGELVKSLFRNSPALYRNKTFVEGICESVDDILHSRKSYDVLLKQRDSSICKVKNEIRILHSQMSKMPASIEKALMAVDSLVAADDGREDNYDLIILRREQTHKTLIAKYIKYWKKSLGGKLKSNSLFYSNIFWVSRDFQESIDDIAHYSFRETFDIRGFERTFEEVEDRFSQSLLEGFEGKGAIPELYKDTSSVYRTIEGLYYVSRSPLMRARLSDVVQLALKRIINHQSNRGLWVFRINRRRSLTSTVMTAAATLMVMKLSPSKSSFNKIKSSINWLIDHQCENGCWNDYSYKKRKGILESPCLLATIFALECLIRNGMSLNNSKVKKSIAWIIKQQDSDGYWTLPWFEDRRVGTAIVLEFLLNYHSIPRRLDEYQLLSKDLNQRSLGVSWEEDRHSAGLSVVLAFQSVEMFLYSALQKYHISIKKSSQKHTIGLEHAWGRVNKELYSRGIAVNSGSHYVQKRAVVNDLPALRDEVVHEGRLPATSKARHLVEHSQGFIRHYSKLIFGHDILY